MPIPSKVGARARIPRRHLGGSSSRWTSADGRQGGRSETARHVSRPSVIMEPRTFQPGSSLHAFPVTRGAAVSVIALQPPALCPLEQLVPIPRLAIVEILDLKPAGPRVGSARAVRA